ncbi:MAG: SEC-C metal-binding domain-containing protein [Wenzhouxiangellaceae bacterium]
MSDKIGRNDPCPCGSGRKYKKCHGQSSRSSSSDDPAQAVSQALQWLEERHRKPPFKNEMESLLFEARAGDSVHHLTREITDPAGAMAARGDVGSPLETMPPGSEDAPPELPPEVLSGLLTEVVRRNYADWADEPVPALGDRTPRDAIQTPAGLDRVKGLLRSYEHGEVRSVHEQNRDPVSFQFLWDELGISRD